MKYTASLCAAAFMMLAVTATAQTDVTIRVTAPGGPPTTLTAGVGATVAVTAAGTSLGFTPRLAGGGGITVDVRALPSNLPDAAAPVLETLAIAGPHAVAISRGGWTVQFIGTRTRPGGVEATTSDYCCVSCGGTEACGCRVIALCGQCCVKPCCETEIGSAPPRRGNGEFASVEAVWSRKMYVTDCTIGSAAEGRLPASLRGS